MKELARKKSTDPFAKVREATLAHRAKHGCGTWPHSNGALLSALAAAADARRILELGTALGYTALSFAHGAPKAIVDTIERDGEHVRLARGNIAAAGMDGRVIVHQGDFGEVLPKLEPGYDLAFFDGHTPVPKLHAELHRLLRPRGVLVTANLNHGGTADAVCEALLDQRTWLTAFVDEDRETAISIKLLIR
jgi:predicted O-methyltransferase YrrM